MPTRVLICSLSIMSIGFAQQKQAQTEFMLRTMESLTPEQRAHLPANGKINRQEWIAAHLHSFKDIAVLSVNAILSSVNDSECKFSFPTACQSINLLHCGCKRRRLSMV